MAKPAALFRSPDSHLWVCPLWANKGETALPGWALAPAVNIANTADGVARVLAELGLGPRPPPRPRPTLPGQLELEFAG